MFFEGFTRTEIKTSGARIVTVHGGKGPPLLLMHGNPFSHLSWQKFAPRLAQEFTVVATDLRGYGDSEKPPGGKNHENYSFRTMAQDQVEVMAALGHDRFFAAGHDRGARVLHRMCLDHPAKVLRAAILDIVPQHHVFNHPNKAWATFSWHWFFMIQPEPFPEHLMSADVDFFIEKKLAKSEKGLSFFDPRCLAEYKRYMRNPATVHAMCEDYRACAGIDFDMDSRDFEAGRKIDAEPGRGMAALRQRHPRRQGAAVRTLSFGRGAGGDLPRVARVLCCVSHALGRARQIGMQRSGQGNDD
jgi:haloacetate dehalogenase